MGNMPPIEDEIMTKGSLEKISNLGKFLQSCLELVEDEKELHTLFSMINHYAQGKTIPTEKKVVNQLLHKKRTNR